MMKRATILLTGAPLLLVACLLSPGCLSPAGEGPGTGGLPASVLAGTEWELASYLGTQGTMTPVLAGHAVTAAFSPDGRLTGSAGCNRYFGGYRGEGGSLAIGSVGSTLMACMDNGVMEQESRYLALLGSVARFRIDGDRLQLSDASGTRILILERAQPEAPRPLAGTPWVLESIATGTGGVSSVLAGTVIEASFSADGKVTGSAGCNRFFADVTVTVASLGIGPRGTTKMFCGEPQGVMEQEQRFLELMGSVERYEISGSRLMLRDPAGSTVLSFRAA